jgi:hypothetical protein
MGIRVGEYWSLGVIEAERRKGLVGPTLGDNLETT